jgi:hypothetical protein
MTRLVGRFGLFLVEIGLCSLIGCGVSSWTKSLAGASMAVVLALAKLGVDKLDWTG